MGVAGILDPDSDARAAERSNDSNRAPVGATSGAGEILLRDLRLKRLLREPDDGQNRLMKRAIPDDRAQEQRFLPLVAGENAIECHRTHPVVLE